MSSMSLALYDALVKYGEQVTLKRPYKDAEGKLAYHEVECWARIIGKDTDELVGNTKQSNLQIIISNVEIAQSNWPGPPKMDDKVLARGRTFTIERQPNSLKQSADYCRHEIIAKGP